MLKEKIQQNLTQSLKSQDRQTVNTLRLLMSMIKNKEIEKKQELTDDEIVQIIRKHIKELDEAKALFKKGGRDDLVSQDEEQVKILSKYLPPEISDEKLEREIGKIIEENKKLYEKNPKAIIGVCMKMLKSKASTKRILAILNSLQE